MVNRHFRRWRDELAVKEFKVPGEEAALQRLNELIAKDEQKDADKAAKDAEKAAEKAARDAEKDARKDEKPHKGKKDKPDVEEFGNIFAPQNQKVYG